MLFVGVDSTEAQLEDSNSMFNVKEANQSVEIVWSLLQSSHLQLTAADIAVIAPFRHQVHRVAFLSRCFCR